MKSQQLINLIAIAILASVLLYACDGARARQAKADYQKCLSWQADGHLVRCDYPKE